jgi:Fe-S oxidoreductase
MCRHACPVSTTDAHEPHIPQAKMARLNEIRRGTKPWDLSSSESLWACTGCRQCTVYCAHGNEPGTVLMAGRAEATARGHGHPAVAEYPDRFRNRDARLVSALRTAVPRERLSSDANVGFWPGCDSIDKNLGDVGKTLALFDRIGADHVRVVDAHSICAGYPLLAAGYPHMFRWHAGKVAAEIERFKTVVVNCSACVSAMRSSYRAEGVTLRPEILHLAEFLAQHSDRIKEPAQKKPVYYHDPCYLARHVGVIDQPRRALARVAEVREFSWSGEDAECCGGAGVLPKTMPATADGMSKRRLAEIARKGGGTVVTACGTCSFMLRRNAPASVEVRDLAGFVEQFQGDDDSDSHKGD